MTRDTNRRDEKGVALLLSILALLLLSAVAVTMMYMSSTETAIAANFKNEETVYFAARAGIEEIRDRMIAGVANYSINGLVANNGCPGNPGSPNCYLPTALPAANNGGVVYLLQNGVTMANVTTAPAAGSPNLYDDELCHDYSFGGMATFAPNVPCTGTNAQPAGIAWYKQPPGAYGVTSVPTGSAGGAAPAWATSNPLDWKWVRITWKANNSTAYPVDSTPATVAANPPVCFNGTSEVPLTPPTAATCQAMVPATNPVYLVTALAVSRTGARRLVQAELAQYPPSAQPGGLFATGTGCGALNLGGGAVTYSFNSAAANPPIAITPLNASTSGGSVGANGNVTVGGTGTTVNGDTSTHMPDTVGNCNGNNGITKNGNANYGTPNQLNTPYTPAVPPFPTNPVPPTSTVTYNSNQTLGAGTYGSVKITGGTITLGQGATTATPAVYTMNSFSVSGGGTINIAGPVVININYSGNGTAVNLGGNGFVNNTYVASNFVINYGGYGNLQVNGGASAYGVINAPNANVTLSGGSNFFGQVLGATIDDSGGTSFFWDTAANTSPVNTNPYFEVSMRELSY